MITAVKRRAFLAAVLGGLFLLPRPGAATEHLIEIVYTTASPPVARAYTEAEFSRLPHHEILTATDFTDGITSFTGPRAIEVIAAVRGEQAEMARFVAANDYAVDIPVADLRRYGVILATAMNGERLSPRGKGPVWVMYPLDDHDELQDPIYNNRLIWQVIRIELK